MSEEDKDLDLQAMKRLEELFHSTLAGHVAERQEMQGYIDIANKMAKYFKEMKDRIESDIYALLKDAGREDEVTYSNGLRFSFGGDRVANVMKGNEASFIEWCKSNGYDDLCRVVVGKTMLNRLMDKDGVNIPSDMVEINEYQKLKILKDTRKETK